MHVATEKPVSSLSANVYVHLEFIFVHWHIKSVQ